MSSAQAPKVKFRIVITLAVIAFLAWDIFPLGERNFYQVMKETATEVQKDDETLNQIIAKAQEIQKNDSEIYPAKAVEMAATEMAANLKPYISKTKDINYNHDVLSYWKGKAKSNLRLGIDLAGGVEFLIKLTADKNSSREFKEDELSDNRDTAIEILRARLEEKGIFETEISPAGDSFISLKAPIVSQDEKNELQKLIQMSANLEFRVVHESNGSELGKRAANPKYAPLGFEYMTYLDQGKGKDPVVREFFVKIKPEMDGKNITRAVPTRDQYRNLEISLGFNGEGADRFGKVTAQNVGNQLAIVLDGKLYSAPNINEAITGGQARISGSFSVEEAQGIAQALEGGSIPFKMDIAAKFDIDPTLGKETSQSGIYAGLIALGIVMVFMLIYYMKAGFVACMALGVNVILVLGCLTAFGATLTLPGIAGIILTIGMAVDANVLIFERIREEILKGKAIQTAIANGYDRAFTTILDANLTTLFTAMILMNVGSGPIKGFAVTLSIGIVTSMFTALFMTRLIFDLMLRSKSFVKMKMLSIVAPNTKFDFLGKKHITLVISLGLILMTIVTGFMRGTENLGIDFTGGTQLTFSYDQEVKNTEIEKVLADKYTTRVSYKTSLIGNEGGDNKKLEIVIRDKNASDSEEVTSPKQYVLETLNAKFPKANFHGGQETTIGGLIGAAFAKSASWAMFLAVIGIIIYISVRFEFQYAVASIAAVIHDVIIATGIFLVCGGELTLSVVAALLTIIGYSLNDTIVVFDRIREDIELDQEKERSFKDTINLSINQTLSRTLLTSVTTLLVLVVLVLVGGVAVRDFVLVMLLGIVIGTYSSIFVASPIVESWSKRFSIKSASPKRDEI